MKITKNLYVALISALAVSFVLLIIGGVADILLMVGLGALIFIPGTVLMAIISENNRIQ